jgi:acyl-CoA reductase-like NAD-dependent aldehyde dehydrogenase
MQARELHALLDDALRARERVRRRSPREIATALAAAATRWRDDPTLIAELPAMTGLSPSMIAAAIPLAAEAIDCDAMVRLAEREREREPGAAEGPRLIAHVLASNVPALALPAIALGCLAGAAVVVKSGHGDRVSGPAFQRALAAVDPDLAATVVSGYWPGGERALDDVLLDRAQVVIATGRDTTLAAIAARAPGKVIGYGARVSVAAVKDDAPAGALALDVVLHDQRGCLSPHAVYVAGDAHAFAERLSRVLDGVAAHLPPGRLTTEERATVRALRDEAEWEGARVLAGPGGTVIHDERPQFRPTCGLRTVRVHPLATLPDVLPPGRVECVGVWGLVPDTTALERLGVSRVCPVGRMQRPPLAWPRGQRVALGTLLGRPGPPRLLLES